MPRTVTLLTAVVLTLWCAARVLVVDALAVPLERVEFAGAVLPGAVIPGERIQGYLARPEGAGPFPAVIGLHGCGGMLDRTKRKLADDLVSWGYVVLLVDSFATRGIDHACTVAFRTSPASAGRMLLVRWPSWRASPSSTATRGRSRLLARWLVHHRFSRPSGATEGRGCRDRRAASSLHQPVEA